MSKSSITTQAAAERYPIDPAELPSYLSYNPETGEFLRLKYAGRSIAPITAGSIHKISGYVCIWVDNKRYAAHRLAWALHYGRWPTDMIDHVDGNPTNNRIFNLREVNNGQNMCNRKAQKNNKVGLKGVRRSSNPRLQVYLAQIRFKGSTYHLGTFDTAEEAHSAYANKAAQLHGSFARAR